MNRYTLNEMFVVEHFKDDEWDNGSHKHNYFELIFVHFGSGYHVINETEIPIEKGQVFLMAPGDKHYFELRSKTHLSMVKFTELLFSGKTNLPDRRMWLQQIEKLMHHPNLVPGDAIRHDEDRKLIWNMFDLLMREYENEKSYHRQIISNAVSTILSILVRNIQEGYSISRKNIEKRFSRIDDILTYIRQHVYDNDLTKINYMSRLFNMSQSSLSNYFKKETGESIHQYITKYKMKLVKYRLQHSDSTISEIAYQLGFTDESHLTKTFKKYFDKSPKQYKIHMLQEQQALAS